MNVFECVQIKRVLFEKKGMQNNTLCILKVFPLKKGEEESPREERRFTEGKDLLLHMQEKEF